MQPDVEYIYDGTFEGFLCCIYASYVRREVPKYIYVEEGLPLLGETATWIPTRPLPLSTSISVVGNLVPT